MTLICSVFIDGYSSSPNFVPTTPYQGAALFYPMPHNTSPVMVGPQSYNSSYQSVSVSNPASEYLSFKLTSAFDNRIVLGLQFQLHIFITSPCYIIDVQYSSKNVNNSIHSHKYHRSSWISWYANGTNSPAKCVFSTATDTVSVSSSTAVL